MRHVASKVTTHNAMPQRFILFIKLALQGVGHLSQRLLRRQGFLGDGHCHLELLRIQVHFDGVYLAQIQVVADCVLLGLNISLAGRGCYGGGGDFLVLLKSY